ncbi:tRNA(Ile)-lysidine synthase [Methyloligella halotolerans]|uniref:tRNA(Ile)-lysidine synthase n=1 Tax=Methyloligella halotolerans TaxID=1177755 RepID=A0A1E2RZB8_9HYPH|nr:tRNA lysidine(34) synthetase TilS [Methyloligella halotolerans]ODA67573.1 tRNA(Ile)-lysidine synthase [Methyloligella halotolerans]
MTDTHSPLPESVWERCFAPLTGYPRLAVAVSGGPDSMALLHLLRCWTESRGDSAEITVLTVDHGLRPESASEAAVVADIAGEMGFTHRTFRWEPDTTEASGIQARARRARYDLMARYCHEAGIPALLTAHHLDDQAETLLMRLARGSGLDGLAAIPSRGDWAGIAIHRPLLDVPKARLIATVAAAGLPYAKDPSNTDSRFERARLRKEQAALQALGLTPEALALAAKRLSRARAALDEAAAEFMASAVRLSCAGSAEVDGVRLRDAPDEIALRTLQRLVAMTGGRQEPVRLAKFETLLDDLRADHAAARTLGGCRIVAGSGKLQIARELRRDGIAELILQPGERALWDNRFVVSLADTAESPVTVRALGEAGARDLADRTPWLNDIPRFARFSLPSCWRNQALVSISCEGLEPDAVRADDTFNARFVHLWDEVGS